MKAKEVRNLPDDEILSEIEKTRTKIFKLKFQAKGTGMENPGTLNSMKREIARMFTVLREREIERKQQGGR